MFLEDTKIFLPCIFSEDKLPLTLIPRYDHCNHSFSQILYFADRVYFF